MPENIISGSTEYKRVLGFRLGFTEVQRLKRVKELTLAAFLGQDSVLPTEPMTTITHVYFTFTILWHSQTRQQQSMERSRSLRIQENW